MRFAALVLLFLPINLLCFMLEGPMTEIGQLLDQFGGFAVCGILLQPWLFLLLHVFMAFPDSVTDFFFRWAFRGAPLHIVVISSVVSAAIYFWAFRLLSYIPFLHRFSRRVPRLVPIVACALLFATYSSACIYVAVHRVPFRYSP
jgi:hypothetical protein